MGGSHNFGARKGAILKAMGLRAGTPDLDLKMARGGYHGLCLEVKGPGGRLSKEQKIAHAKLIAQGYCVLVGEGKEACKDILIRYMLGKIRREGIASE